METNEVSVKLFGLALSLPTLSFVFCFDVSYQRHRWLVEDSEHTRKSFCLSFFFLDDEPAICDVFDEALGVSFSTLVYYLIACSKTFQDLLVAGKNDLVKFHLVGHQVGSLR